MPPLFSRGSVRRRKSLRACYRTATVGFGPGIVTLRDRESRVFTLSKRDASVNVAQLVDRNPLWAGGLRNHHRTLVRRLRYCRRERTPKAALHPPCHTKLPRILGPSNLSLQHPSLNRICSPKRLLINRYEGHGYVKGSRSFHSTV